MTSIFAPISGKPMQVTDDLSTPVDQLTIGVFDGVHLGHQAIFKKLNGGAVLTYTNHPSTILRPEPTPLLTSFPHKLRLLEQLGIETVIAIPFTKELSELSAETFLNQLNFKHLILGYDACIGHKREGTSDKLKELGVNVTYLDPLLIDGEPISSSRVRQAVAAGDLKQTERLLGRELSYFSTVIRGAGKGKQLGYPTANLDVSKLSLPPFGVYAVTLTHQDRIFQGVANLGVAPTLQAHRKPTLEVHCFEYPGEIHGEEVEVILHRFLRPEQRFGSVDELKAQIAQDIEQTRTG